MLTDNARKAIFEINALINDPHAWSPHPFSDDDHGTLNEILNSCQDLKSESLYEPDNAKTLDHIAARIDNLGSVAVAAKELGVSPDHLRKVFRNRCLWSEALADAEAQPDRKSPLAKCSARGYLKINEAIEKTGHNWRIEFPNRFPEIKALHATSGQGLGHIELSPGALKTPQPKRLKDRYRRVLLILRRRQPQREITKFCDALLFANSIYQKPTKGRPRNNLPPRYLVEQKIAYAQAFGGEACLDGLARRYGPTTSGFKRFLARGEGGKIGHGKRVKKIKEDLEQDRKTLDALRKSLTTVRLALNDYERAVRRTNLPGASEFTVDPHAKFWNVPINGESVSQYETLKQTHSDICAKTSTERTPIDEQGEGAEALIEHIEARIELLQSEAFAEISCSIATAIQDGPNALDDALVKHTPESLLTFIEQTIFTWEAACLADDWSTVLEREKEQASRRTV